MRDQLRDIEENMHKKGDEILLFERKRGHEKPTLTILFNEIDSFLDMTYVQIQRLMTKNKLLFYSDDEEYLEDQELKEKIKLDNRRA